MKKNSFEVQLVDAAELRPLRQRVLRPHQTAEELVYPGDDAQDSRHFVARQRGEIVAIASLYRMDHDREPVGEWRLRGMASSPEARGSGAGGLVLRAAIAHAAERSPSALWCNARIGACPFYEHFDFRSVGPIFEIEGIGPHYLMTRKLDHDDSRLIESKLDPTPKA